MRAAVEVLSSARGAYKVAVLGDMFELGPLAPALHAGVGDYLGKAGIDCLVAVGELARHIHDAAQAAGVPECYYCPTKAEARPVLDGVVRPHATILVKASRGMALEELVDYLLTITAVSYTHLWRHLHRHHVCGHGHYLLYQNALPSELAAGSEPDLNQGTGAGRFG